MQMNQEDGSFFQRPQLRAVEGNMASLTEQEERISNILDELKEINPEYAEIMRKCYLGIADLVPECIKGYADELNQEEQQHLKEGILKKAEEILAGSRYI